MAHPTRQWFTFWLILVYFPFVHMVWGGGILEQWGVLDFAGGIVVHNIAGIAALASVLYVGKRKVLDRGPHSIPLVALGTGLLWFGWYGFNAGSEVAVNAVTWSSTACCRRRTPRHSRPSPGSSWSGSLPRSLSSLGCSLAPWPGSPRSRPRRVMCHP